MFPTCGRIATSREQDAPTGVFPTEIHPEVRRTPFRLREICGSQLCSVVLRGAKLQRAPLGKLMNLQVTLSQRLRS
jgi:hypothetical protein